MRYCRIHNLEYFAQCDACAARDKDLDGAARFNRTLNRAHKEDVINAMVKAQRLADAVVEAAIDWHKSDMDESMDAAQTLEDAIEELLEFRRKMPIVKSR